MGQPLYKGLQVVDLIGVFYEEKGRLMVADEFDGAVDVFTVLEGVNDQEIRILAHHRPVEPLDRERWGGGCCYLESTGCCPFGHQDTPLALYAFNEVGVLRVEGRKLLLEVQDGIKEISIPLLMGHRSQILITSIPNLEELDKRVKSFDPSNIENPTFENLTDRLSELRDFLAKMNDLKSDL